jgi:hypothetical protein
MKSWDKDEVLVEIERRGPDQKAAEALVVNMSQEGNRIVVDAPAPSDRRDGIHIGSWQSPSVSLIVTAPRKVSVDARTGDGSISADDLAGTVGLSSGDGSIRARRIEGSLRARTGDGSISVTDGAGRVEADSGDGSVELTGRFDAIDVRTGDGAVRLDVLDGSALKTIGASIQATARSRFGCRRISMPTSMRTPVMAAYTPMACLSRPSETTTTARTVRSAIRCARNSERAAARCGSAAATARSISLGKGRGMPRPYERHRTGVDA